jgi:selenide,water dikinase
MRIIRFLRAVCIFPARDAIMKRLLLLGGGHSHVEVVRRFADAPPGACKVRLISPDRYTPYSGMLPGLVAGHYTFGECHIDLERLCRHAGVELHATAAKRIDPENRRVTCENGESYAYDVLSIDVGALPDAHAIPGAAEHAIGVKPVARFLAAWEAILKRAGEADQALRVALIGGGAAGIELALAMRHRVDGEATAGHLSLELHVLSNTGAVPSGHPRRVQRIVERIARDRGIRLHLGTEVTSIAPGAVHRKGGPPLAADFIVLATGASPPPIVSASDLENDERGFIAVNSKLQSPSRKEVFAAGDVASMVESPRPKSGVFAVRQGPPLAENLRRALAGDPLLAYRPQKTALALISTGGRHAVASWHGLAVAGRWVWWWKDRIDRRFMAKYRPRDAGT